MTKVITYQALSGVTIELTRKPLRMLARAGTWPRNSRGEEYCFVSHDLHTGIATWNDKQVAEMCQPKSK